MFTDGLDNNALQWVRKEQARTASAPTSGKGSPDITRDHAFSAVRMPGKGWGLPPSQLPHVHIHSGLLRPPFSSDHTTNISDDLEESVGSISAGNPTQDDYDSGEEQESGLYSPDSSPSGSPPPHSAPDYPSETVSQLHERDNDMKEAQLGKGNSLKAEPIEVEDYYDRHLPISRRESFGRRESFRKESFGRRDSSGRRDEFGRRDSFGRKDSFGRRDSFDLQAAYTGSGRYFSETGREDMTERGDLCEMQAFQGRQFSSGTELSDDDDTADEEEATDSVPYRSHVQSKAGYPQIAIDPASTGHDSHSMHATAHEARPNSALDKDAATQAPARPWVSESDLQFQEKPVRKERAEMLRHSQSESVPPSAPPMFAGMVLDQPEVPPPTPTFSSLTAFSFETDLKQHSESLKPCEPSVRSVSTRGGEEVGLSSRNTATSMPLMPPVYPSGQAAWQAVLAYDACVRLCLRAWARGCMEAPEFLQDECSLLRDCFGLQRILLQPHEEGKMEGASEDADASATTKPKRTIGRVKVQVRKVKILTKQPLRRSFASVDPAPTGRDLEGKESANKRSPFLTGWAAVRKLRFIPKSAVRSTSSSSQRSLAYVNAGAQYVRQVSGILKDKVNSLRHSALAEAPQESFSCVLRLKSSPEEDAVRMQPGSSDTSVFLPETSGDDLLLEIQDSKGTSHGRLVVQLASIGDDPNDRVRWYGIYSEPEHECVGKVQLFLNYTVTSGEIGSAKWGPVGETRAYDIVLEVAMRVQQFQRRNLRLHGSWLWLLAEFASCYGVSDSYTKLRYLVCIMEVATPTEDCLVLIHDLLCPIIKARDENSLNRQEKRILADVEEQVAQLLALVFENYKSLDETSPSGLADISTPASGTVALALVPAVQIYTLLHDILTLEAQSILRNYFKTAARKRCKRHMAETDEYVSSNSEGFLMDPLSMASAYLKMKTLCMHISKEVRADIDIHNKHVLPSSIDLPNIAASIYNMELANRLRTFLVACPPSCPSAPVAELMIATADFQRDLGSWGVRAQKGGVDAKDLFHLYIVLWIQDKRLHLLDFCKFDKERWTWVTTQHSTSPFVEEVYERIKDTLNEYEVIISRWPEYTIALENAVADVERAVIGALEKQYAEVLLPLKDVMVPKKFSLQYMQKLTRRRSISIYSVPSQLGVMLNSVKRLLDTLRPKIEAQMKAWVACLPGEGAGPNRVLFGERLNEVTIELRAKYKNFLQAIVEKLADNARLQRTTKLKQIVQDTREAGGESEIRERMQPLNTQLVDTISHLHDVFTTRVFVAVCRGYWDRMARDVLHFLENRKENRSWYKGSSFALGILDDVFATQMQRLQGRALQEKDLEPPRSVMEARSMLSRDVPNGKGV